MKGWTDWLDASLAEVGARDRLRVLRSLEPAEALSPVHVAVEGRELILFSGNDYLGLSAHPEVREAFAASALRAGAGPRGSPLVCGYTRRHGALERAIAALKGTEDALLFPTGFAANLAVLDALGGSQGTTIFSDELNHASIVDGCRFARARGAELRIYPHLDVDALESMLDGSGSDRTLIVTESVFSVDGDLAPLDRLAEIRDRHGALLVLDEAHATLVFGGTGAGVAERFGVSGRVDVQVGTLSKAAGVMGGFAASSSRIRAWLLNRGRSYVFSTALPVPVVEAALRAMDVARRDPSLRDRLWERVEQLGSLLGRKLYAPIVSLVLGEESAAVSAACALIEEGYHVVAIRPPTVPPGSSRLRVTLSAAHRAEDVEGLAKVLQHIL